MPQTQRVIDKISAHPAFVNTFMNIGDHVIVRNAHRPSARIAQQAESKHIVIGASYTMYLTTFHDVNIHR